MSGPMRHPTYTSQILEALVIADDALTVRDIAARVRMDTRRVSSILHSLYRYFAVDAIEGQRELWWYATPEDDTRCRVIKQMRDGGTRRSKPHPGIKRRKPNERPVRGGK